MKQFSFLEIVALITSPSLWKVKGEKIICESEKIYFFSSCNGTRFRYLDKVHNDIAYDTNILSWYLLLPFILFLKGVLFFRK